MTQPKTKLRGPSRAPAPDGSQIAAHREGDARAAAARVARESYGKLVAYLAMASRDVPGAEDALAEAFTAALTVWPMRACPRIRRAGWRRPRGDA